MLLSNSCQQTFLSSVLQMFYTKFVDNSFNESFCQTFVSKRFCNMFYKYFFTKVIDTSFNESCWPKIFIDRCLTSVIQMFLTKVIDNSFWWNLLIKVVDKNIFLTNVWQVFYKCFNKNLLTKVLNKVGNESFWQVLYKCFSLQLWPKIVTKSCWKQLLMKLADTSL
jgi:hypothetical protein